MGKTLENYHLQRKGWGVCVARQLLASLAFRVIDAKLLALLMLRVIDARLLASLALRVIKDALLALLVLRVIKDANCEPFLRSR
jgi:predicted transcriptional regulator